MTRNRIININKCAGESKADVSEDLMALPQAD